MIALEKVATRIWRSRRNLVSARRGLPWMEGATAGSNRSRRLVGTNTDHPPGRKVEDSCPGAPPSSGSPLEPERT